ncbi:extracellular solute-binding protein [Paenibacillus qinlingensis]|uniref:Multiple sugar transport system substrate-binding protein n=1 Tax=Paenibacillus qinlingensis TaxID=1837343 RepID=A0ABU1NNW1_9BACL|nr:extracellular solute-binding protein [Paenibacillus qinlingensis]MDR6549174.1 multiple sugar transport system substrate-binding protein [Paenibacillus qinlingensis]
MVKGRKSFRERLNEMVGTLRKEIIQGTLQAGDFLPSEIDLSRKFDLSNLSVRKGLQTLVEEGYITKIPSVGNQVIEQFKQQKCHIRFVYPADLEESVQISSLLDQFEALYPHIEIVRIAESGGDYTSYLRSGLQEGQVDVALLSDSVFYSLTAEQDAAAYFAPTLPLEGQYRMLAQSFSQNEHLYASPFSFSPLVLCYNKSHFREMSLAMPDSSWTWSDLAEHAKLLTQPNTKYGFYFYTRSRNRWPLFLMQNGVEAPRDHEGSIPQCVEQIKDGLNDYRRVLDGPMLFPHFLANAPLPLTPEALFAQGKLSMIITSYFHLNRLLNLQDIDFDIAPIPRGKEAKTLLITLGIAIANRSQNKDEAALLAQFFTSYDSQVGLRLCTTSIPALRSAAELEGADMAFSRYTMYRDIVPTYTSLKEMGLSSEKLDKIMEAAQLNWSMLEDEATLNQRLTDILT